MAKKGKFSQPRTPRTEETELDREFLELPAEDDLDTLLGVIGELETEAGQAFDADLDSDVEPTPAAERNKKVILISLCSVALVVLIGLIIGVVFLVGGGKDDGLILNNVTVAGVNLGGMTQEEAVRVLRAATGNTFTQEDMVIVLPDTTLTLSPADTGAKLDVEAAAEAAYLYGRTGTRAEQQAAYEQSLTGAHHIALLPYMQLNTDYIKGILEEYCKGVTSDFVQSSASLDGEMPELSGDKFDPEAPCQTLQLNPGTPGRDLSLETLYNMVLDAYSFNNFRVELKEDGLSQTPDPLDLEALLEEYSTEPVDARLDPETMSIVPEVYGYSFDLEKARELLEAAKPGETVSIPMEYVEPQYTRESLFADVLGACETKHTLDENRNTNLRLACAAIDGMILFPGDIFDYNVVVGERTVEKGYKAAAAYSGGQTIKEIGGGICQVSSTLYLAALRADLEIVDRTEHSYISTYIPYGMDATVSWRGPEFRFRNNTDHAIRIDAEVSDGYVRVNLMSIDDRDYYVEIEYRILAWEEYETVYEELAPDNAEGYKDGDVITTPYTGCTVRTYRCRYDRETGELISREEEARSKYKKRDEVIAKIVDPSEPTDETTDEPTDGSTEDPSEGTTAPEAPTDSSTTPPGTEAPPETPTDAPTPPPESGGSEETP